MKVLLFIVFISCFVSCNDNAEPVYSQRVEILPYQNFKEIIKLAQQQRQADSLKELTLKYGIYHDKKYIPASVIQYLSEKYPDPFSKKGWKIANPDEEADLTCSISGDLPNRQLIALAKGDRHYILYYLQGRGIVANEEIIILQLQKNKIIRDTIISSTNLDFMKIVKKLSQKR
ncbi:hypothetical protein AD998_13965 [bacterium 336/3]|nr:hypothetical protein AD998_13965 [bacterium 336/3]